MNRLSLRWSGFMITENKHDHSPTVVDIKSTNFKEYCTDNIEIQYRVRCMNIVVILWLHRHFQKPYDGF